MCDLDKEFQLCTCKGDVNTDGSYWIFYRVIKDKLNLVIGEAALCDFINPETEIKNKALLLETLNQVDPFDINLNPKENDRPALFFRVDKEFFSGKHLNYGFVYKRHRWHSMDYDPLEWEWKHDYELEGIIKN